MGIALNDSVRARSAASSTLPHPRLYFSGKNYPRPLRSLYLGESRRRQSASLALAPSHIYLLRYSDIPDGIVNSRCRIWRRCRADGTVRKETARWTHLYNVATCNFLCTAFFFAISSFCAIFSLRWYRRRRIRRSLLWLFGGKRIIMLKMIDEWDEVFLSF